MKHQKINNRSILFTDSFPDWNLSIQLILGDHYNYLIDTGLGSGSMDPILPFIKQSTKPLIVINTHFHWDHIWGNHIFSDSLIIAHQSCNELIQAHWDQDIKKFAQNIRGEVKFCLPNLLIEKSIYFREDQICIFHTPGHTMDSISVLDEKDGVLNVGDNIGDSLEELIPSLDCDVKYYQETLNHYAALQFDTCISGHNIVLGKQVISEIQNQIYAMQSK